MRERESRGVGECERERGERVGSGSVRERESGSVRERESGSVRERESRGV